MKPIRPMMPPFAPKKDSDGSKRHIRRDRSFHRPAGERVDWVDYAKGICIVMVVMMHSVLGVELAAGQTGFMHLVVMFAKPFRMPDFFLISGLFVSVVIDRDWRTYLDRKVVHFAYFYVLWVTIQFGFKAPGLCRRDRAGAMSAISIWNPSSSRSARCGSSICCRSSSW